MHAVERVHDRREADERVLAHLARLGCDPGTPRETTHYVYLPRRDGADSAAETLDGEGWSTRVEPCAGDSWLVVATQVSALTPVHVRETRRRLEGLAAEHGGLYDGWEARTDRPPTMQ